MKPASILLTGRDGHDHAYLTLGFTRRLSAHASYVAMRADDYSPPEQILGDQLDARADSYSLGCVLVALLSGLGPFARAAHISMMFAHSNDAPPSLARVDPQLRRFDPVIQRALSKSPSHPFESADALGRAAVAASGRTPGAAWSDG